MSEAIRVWFHAGCSKSRAARALLEERGIDADYYEYQKTPPTREQLLELLAQLGTDDPRTIVRRKEVAFAELGLGDADRESVLAALSSHPVLVERPIVVRDGRAIVARPPERLLELFDQ